MRIHVLTGDSLAENFPSSELGGEIIVSRECLIEGPLIGRNLPKFWQTRAAFISSNHGDDKNLYAKNVAGEYQKLLLLKPADEVNLWFEYDLFCQVNLWFTLYLLSQSQADDVYRIAPNVRNQTDLWRGFGRLTSKQLEECFAMRVKLTSDDVSLGAKLWLAYQNNNLDELRLLAENESDGFPYLREVCAAEIDRKVNHKPEHTLREITSAGITEFPEIFAQFSKQEGIYGFGDSQVKRILAEMI